MISRVDTEHGLHPLLGRGQVEVKAVWKTLVSLGGTHYPLSEEGGMRVEDGDGKGK